MFEADVASTGSRFAGLCRAMDSPGSGLPNFLEEYVHGDDEADRDFGERD
jgi:hypothetical protein